ncbi:MAG: CoA transferase subunit A [Acidobacteria bacterium]|nr:CoA transferase subunit A [Acidobacteriota bacterium]
MSKLISMREAVAQLVPGGGSVAMGLQLEQMIPFAAGHEIIRQRKRGLNLIGPISDILFDQVIAAGCVETVTAAWVGNVMMGSAYNFRRAVERENPGQPGATLRVIDMTNFTVALALQAGAMGVPFLPTRTALGSDLANSNPFFASLENPFAETGSDKLHAIRALNPDVAIVHLQRADAEGNAHCWGNFGVMIEAVHAAKRVIVVAEEIVAPEIISSDPNRTVIPGFLVSAVVECPGGAHPSPVQGCYRRDDAFFRHYHQQTVSAEETAGWLDRWIYRIPDRAAYLDQLGACRFAELKTQRHAWAAPTDYGY